MNIDTFFETLDSYFERNEIDRIDSFLVSSLEQAKEEEDYAAYISICNEMIGFYRSTSAFEKAYVAAEDVLLLMEELKLDHTEHFATTLLMLLPPIVRLETMLMHCAFTDRHFRFTKESYRRRITAMPDCIII